MSFMPIMFTFFFYGFPSGLVLYWLWNNVLTIAQQYMINKKGNDTGEKVEPQIRGIGTNREKKQQEARKLKPSLNGLKKNKGRRERK